MLQPPSDLSAASRCVETPWGAAVVMFQRRAVSSSDLQKICFSSLLFLFSLQSLTDMKYITVHTLTAQGERQCCSVPTSVHLAEDGLGFSFSFAPN